jgi:hypothetical protein
MSAKKDDDTGHWPQSFNPAKSQERQPQSAQILATRQKSGTSAGGLSEEEPLPPIRPSRYEAYRPGRTRPALRIDTATQGMHFPAYHTLADVLFDSDHQATIILIFDVMTVRIIGENLWPVAYIVGGRRCESIHEYHSDLYDEPPVPGEPVIRKITFEPIAGAYEIGKE